MTRTFVQAKVTKTAAFVGTTEVDISGITGDWTVHLRIAALAGQARFEFQDTVDNFTAHKVQKAFGIEGTITDDAPVFLSYKKADLPMSRFGVGSGELRLSLTDITATTGSVTYEAWIEY